MCDTIPFLFSLTNTCGSAYFLPGQYGKNTQRLATQTTIINILDESMTNFSFLCLTMHAFFQPTCVHLLPSSPTNDHLWNDPGPTGKNIQRATYLRIHTHFFILNEFHECVTQYFLFPPSQTPVGRPAYFLPGAPGNFIPKGLTIYSTTLDILRECVTQYFLLPSSQTPVGWPTSYQVEMVRTSRGLATHSSILHIIHECVTHSFLSIHEHPRGNHVNKVQ